MSLDSKIPEGPLAEKWTKHKFNLKLVNPSNKRKYDIIVVGTGLAGGAAAVQSLQRSIFMLAEIASQFEQPADNVRRFVAERLR